MQKGYEWLLQEPGPKMVLEMIQLFGTHEVSGAGDNPEIVGWGREVGHPDYVHDAIPWCGLAMAVAAKRAGWDYNPNGNSLWALNWTHWGVKQPVPMLGDVLVFGRQGGGHVSMYVGEDSLYFHILGGNQSDQVNIVRKAKSELVSAQRAHWKIAQPANVRRIVLSATGAPISTKES